jgi:2'-5' RNA ligase
MTSVRGDLFMGQDGRRRTPGGRRPAEAEPWPGAVYFALKPGAAAVDQAAAIGGRLRLVHRLSAQVSVDVLHVTLCSLGLLPDLPAERIDAAREIAGRLAAHSFEIRFDRVRSHPVGRSKLPLVAFAGDRAPRAELFRRRLVSDLRMKGLVSRKDRPDAHMTLLYDRCVVAEEAIDPISWTVRDFVLVHSLHGRGQHVELGRWPLRA